MYRIDGSFEFDVTRTFAVCRSFWSEIFVCGDPHASNFSGSFEIKKGHDYGSSGYDFHLRIGGINNGILCFHHNLLMDLCARYSAVIPGIFI